MKNGRFIQIAGSFLIAFIIRSVLSYLFANPVFSYARVYACLVCILLLLSAPRSGSQSSGTETKTVREEWIVDGRGNRVRLFNSSDYPDFKLIEKEVDGNIYSSNEGELITTVVVTRTQRSGTSDSAEAGDLVTGLAVIILIVCLLSVVLQGIFNTAKNKFSEAVESASNFFESNFGNPGEDLYGESSDNAQGIDGSNTAAGDSQENYEEAYEEEYQVEETPQLMLTDYGIFKDGRGIASSDYVFADSDKRNLTRSDVDQLTLRGINYAKNELYARHGRKFKSKELRNFFESRDWYSGWLPAEPDSDKIIEKDFNSYEKHNSDFLVEIESSMGMYKLDQ